ncbi:thioredoxin fold domain-containing protein [bacterium]|nr:thioredoxin fold domain-containing protein [bacterium]
MKKKFIIAIAIIAFCLVATIGACVYAIAPLQNLKPSDYNIGISYQDEMKTDKPAVVLFYANWCTYCKHFMPEYKLLSELYSKDFNFVMVDIDAPEYQKIVKDYSVASLPSMYIVDPAIDNRVLINNALYSNLFAVRVEIERYIRIRKLINIPTKDKK